MSSSTIREWGLTPGNMMTGKCNRITDVPGVKVGQCTIRDGKHNTGVTVLIPREDIYYHPCTAAGHVINGYGKTVGLVQIQELGRLETPIALTNTLNVGLVSDAMIQYTKDCCAVHGETLRSVNPVVGECNDGSLSAIYERVVGYSEFMQAVRNADTDFEQGCVGAGTGMICHGLKGGIGSSSRIVKIEDKEYVIGILALCNHGDLNELNILGRRPGAEIRKRLDELIKTDDSGSCILVLATDLPVSSRQLGRIVKRCGIGLARCGSFWGHGSGDVAIGFTTAQDWDRKTEDCIFTEKTIREDCLDTAFAAAAEASEESVLNALAAAQTMRGADGRVCHALCEFRDLL